MDETFYFHCLRYYIPRIARETYEDFKLGVGIFNMQGFKRRNKESKMMMQRRCNHKGQTIRANLEKVWQIFNDGDDDVEEE